MKNTIYNFNIPENEHVHSYAPNCEEREFLKKELKKQSSEIIEIPLIIGGKEYKTGVIEKVVLPHNHRHKIATFHKAGKVEIEMAIKAALEAKGEWDVIPYLERAAIFLRVAELISKKYRYVLNAATMLGQSKNAYQAEIDAACETIDFLRFNVHYQAEIYSTQPESEPGQLNRIEYRPLEGFVFTVSPFNFTAIASNLSAAPALMGNTIVWKPATTSLLSNYYLMKIFKEAGVPDGVFNFIPGQGSLIGNHALNHSEFAGLHFTGSTGTFNNLWQQIGKNINSYKSYPAVVGETGGKDFIFVHSSANLSQVATAIVRGAYEYQGQKCSAASRAYIPKSMWLELKDMLLSKIAEIKIGDVTDFSNFMNAVIDEKSYDNIMNYINITKESADAEILIGGKGDKSEGYFIEPTLIQTTDAQFITMTEEIFGPVMTIYIYNDGDYEKTLHLCDQTSPYGLTGAVFANERKALIMANEKLRYSAGNFYINDKPSGAVVGQQPFGGARASGTNDKAGSHYNILRWVSPRTIKETFVAEDNYSYPFMSA